MHDALRRMRGFAADRELAFEVAVERHAIMQQIMDTRAGLARQPERHSFIDQARAKGGHTLDFALAAEDRSFGSPELLRATLGVEPGTVTPFAVLNDTDARVSVVLDAVMMQHPILNYHPLRNTMTTSIARDDLIRFLAATGHPPRIVGLAQPPEASP